MNKNKINKYKIDITILDILDITAKLKQANQADWALKAIMEYSKSISIDTVIDKTICLNCNCHYRCRC